MPFQAGGVGGVKTLSDLQIDVDKDWKAYDINYLGDLTPKVDGAYNLGSPSAKFDTAYATSFPPPSTLIYNTKSGMADTIYSSPPDGPAAFFDGAWSAGLVADIMDSAYLTAAKAGSILDHSNLSGSAKTGKRTDIMTHPNLSRPKFNDIIAESVYGMAAGDLAGVKGFVYQVGEEKDFHSITETPNHAYWHRIYNTPAAFETIYQDYTTKLDEHGTTPSKSAPGTADPNPQPGACWSVAQIPDGAQIRGWASGGGHPTSIAWDGTYLWQSSLNAHYVYQFKPDGTQTGGFATPARATGVTWDGEYLWCASDTTGAKYIYHMTTGGTQVGGFTPPSSNPQGVAWTGTYLWHADTAGFIYQLKTDGTRTNNGFASPGPSPGGVGWDGVYLWIGLTGGNYIYQMTTDGAQVGGFTGPATDSWGAGWDGAYLWITDETALWVYQLGNAGNFDVNYRIFAK